MQPPKPRCAAGPIACANPENSENVETGRALPLLWKQFSDGRQQIGWLTKLRLPRLQDDGALEPKTCIHGAG
jgi:hypothetical protein